MMRFRQYLCSFLLLFFNAFALADVWGYVDEKGIPRFATEKLDDRYELFFRSNLKLPGEATAPAAGGVASGAAGTFSAGFPDADALPLQDYPRAVAVPKLPSKLMVFFDISPGFKSVRHLMRESATTHNLDFELLQALIVTESGFDPAAVSPKGAVGLMQLMPATAQRFGVSPDPKQPTATVAKQLVDPQTNIKAGSRYLRYLMNMFPGKLELALAAYNAGEGAVQRAGNQIPNYKETQNYVKTVMQLYSVLKPPILVADPRRVPASAPGRVRIELPGPTVVASPRSTIVGGAKGRGNMITPLVALENSPPVTVSD
jgi:Transglycosylase SLT domain